MRFRIFIAAFWTLAAAGAGDFYVWQRDWTPEVRRAAAESRKEGRQLFVLAAEAVAAGGDWRWQAIALPEGLLDDPGVTAVLRAPSAMLDRPERLVEALAAEIGRLGVDRVQLDIDAAERQLAAYAGVLAALREALPEIELSVTLLPAHLGRPEAAEVVASVDWYVVQLHGIEPPRRRDEAYRLMRREVVETALAAARELGGRWRVALPTYAYVLRFAEDGSFVRLYAENVPASAAGDPACDVAAPDGNLIAEVLRDCTASEVIWFRLPVPGDRLNLDMAAIAQLEAGRAPEPAVAVEWERRGHAWILTCRIEGAIRIAPFTVALAWPEDDGEFIALNGTAAVPPSPYGRLPGRITVVPGGCGETVPAAMFLTGSAAPDAAVEW